MSQNSAIYSIQTHCLDRDESYYLSASYLGRAKSRPNNETPGMGGFQEQRVGVIARLLIRSAAQVSG